jgi:nanoRNase/pAp phosphatase (c-di-AMP/oligoRNAs hydrolase)
MTKREPFRELLELIDPKERVVIQTHDFPDQDAIGAAFGLRGLLLRFGVEADLCYGGAVQNLAIIETIRALEIPIRPLSLLGAGRAAQIILVDGFAGNTNVTGLPGRLVGIVDHHPAPFAPDVPFADIRPWYGSCSTMVWEYYRSRKLAPERAVATALLMGIMVDTGYLSRGVDPADLQAFSELHFSGDSRLAASLLHNAMSVRDLDVFGEALSSWELIGDVCFILLRPNDKRGPELLGMIADFFLRLREIHVVIAAESYGGDLRISARSDDSGRHADEIVRAALQGRGSGGGPAHMAGGLVPSGTDVVWSELKAKFLELSQGEQHE